MAVVKEPEDAPRSTPFFSPLKETGQSLSVAPTLVEYGVRRNLIVLAIMFAVLLEILDTTIVNVAPPTIQGSLGQNFEAASWIVTAYLIVVIIALPVAPWLENLFGRRRYCVISILGFTLASAAPRDRRFRFWLVVRAAQRSGAFIRSTERDDKGIGHAVAFSAVGGVAIDGHHGDDRRSPD